MVGMNRAATIAQIGAMTTPKITEGRSIDVAGAVRGFLDAYNQGRNMAEKKDLLNKKQAYIDALSSGDQDQINKAWAAYDPQSFASFMQNQAKRAEDRQWALDDLATAQDFQRELAQLKFAQDMKLEGVKNANAWGLKRWDLENTLAQKEMERQQALEDAATQREFQKELAELKFKQDSDLEGIKSENKRSLKEFELTGGMGTTAQQNVKAMIDAGYSPQEAWAMYYGGNNPTLDMANLGKKGMDKANETLGKNYAADLEEYNNMMSKLPELEETVKMLNQLGKNATFTTAGKGLNLFRKEFGLDPTQSAVDRAAYVSMIDNQILPLLRDTFGAQFTEREGNTLRKTLGDADATPQEKEAALSSFIRQKRKSIESKARKIQSYRSSLKDFEAPATDEDAWGI